MLQPAHTQSRRAQRTAVEAAQRPRTTAVVGAEAPRTIVVGYDGSEPAKRALARAAVLADTQTRIIVVAAVEPYPGSEITIPANRDPVELGERRRDLEEARRFLSHAGILAQTVLSRGRAEDVLLESAADADMLIVGSRRLGRLERLILGSVSSKVVHDAACDVLVVR